MGEFLIDVTTVQWAYFGLLIAFTICLAMLLPLTSSSGLKWWLLSNLTTAAAMPLFIWRPIVATEALTFLLPATLIVSSAALKLLAVSSPGLRRRIRWPLAGTVFAFAVCYQILDLTGMGTQRFSLSAGMLCILTAAVAFAAKYNSLWAGLWGRKLLIAAFAFSSVILGLLFLRAVTGGMPGAYFSPGKTESITFALNIIQVIVVHIGFIALLVGRVSKITAFKAARQQQLIRGRKLAEEHSRQMELIAQERRGLLDLLSHEVRQPLNNAQAALQEVSRTIGERKLQDLGMSQPVSRLHNTIDQVVLALSNAIVGTSVIERQTDQLHHELEITAIAELASGDCPIGEQPRIRLTGLTEPIFMQGDPILLRLAFRNLLDNAIKFSAPATPVTATVRVDSDRFGVVFDVFNTPKEPFHPHARLFERAHRGGSQSVSGKGLGLFIVQEVATIHNGTASARIADDGRTCFELFLPL